MLSGWNKEDAAEIKNWVQQGGKIIAMESAAAQIAKADWGIKLKKSDDELIFKIN